ncbi:MAG: thiamine-phosphate kinase [bacterium]
MKHWEELTLIKSIRKHKTVKHKDVLIGIGDDTAVVDSIGGEKLLYTVDSIVDGIHFLGNGYWRSAGKRAIGAAASDIAAMGGVPLYALLSLFLPKALPLKCIDEFMDGFFQRLKAFNIALIGGNITTMNGKFAADTMVIGKSYRGRFVTRSGAKIGDAVCMLGVTGEAMAGLDLLLSNKKALYPKLIKRYLEPTPMLKESIMVVEALKPNAMIDVSDGLIQDLMHIAEESRVGVVLDLDSIPVTEPVRDTARLMKKSPYDYVLTGGDDYVLLFTVPEHRYKTYVNGMKVYKIGKIVQTKGIKFYKDGKRVSITLKKQGYVHGA